MLREPRTKWPAHIDEPSHRPPALDGSAAVVTFIGHSTFLIQTAAGNILTDPMYSERAGPLNRIGPRRVRKPAVRFDDLPAISTVLLSHTHYDHCDLRTLRTLATRHDPLVVTPLENGRLVRSAGIRHVEELDWWQQAKSSAPDHGDARSAFLREPHSIETALSGAGSCWRLERHASSSRAIRPTDRFSTTFATGSARSIWRFCHWGVRTALVHASRSHESVGCRSSAFGC
jgi:hypothetical protein